jgi:hypothetical protein
LITITSKEHLPVAPILESLDHKVVIEVARGKKYEWVYKLSVLKSLLLENSAVPTNQWRFRLEIIR